MNTSVSAAHAAGEENVQPPATLTLHRASAEPWALAIHGGAGGRILELGEQADYASGLREAHAAGEAVLSLSLIHI